MSTPVPPVFHVQEQRALQHEGAEIHLLLTFHEKMRMSFAFTPAQARCLLKNIERAEDERLKQEEKQEART